MAWVRVSDDFYDHEKFCIVSLAARGLWITALAYCNRRWTDGALGARIVQGFAGKQASALAKELVEAGLWDRTPTGYVVHDYHDYQPKAVDVEAKAKATAEARIAAGRVGGLRSGEARRTKRDEATPEQTEATGSKTEAFASDVEANTNHIEAPDSRIPVPDPEDPDSHTQRGRMSVGVDARVVPASPLPPSDAGPPSHVAPGPPSEPPPSFDVPPRRSPTPRPSDAAPAAPVPPTMPHLRPTTPAPAADDDSPGAQILRAFLRQPVLVAAEANDFTVLSGALRRIADGLEGKRIASGASLECALVAIGEAARDLQSAADASGSPPRAERVSSVLGRYFATAVKNARNPVASRSDRGGGPSRPRNAPPIQRDTEGDYGADAARAHVAENPIVPGQKGFLR